MTPPSLVILGPVPRIWNANEGCDVEGHMSAHQILGTGPRMTSRIGLTLALLAAPTIAWALDLPATHKAGEMLHPGQYACADGSTPTSEFDILDGTAYFLRGTTLRAGELAYDQVTGKIDWKTGPFAGNHITAYNTVRVTDKKPVIIMRYEPAGEEPSTEYCTILE